MVRAATVLLLAAAAAILVHSAWAVRIVSGPPQTSIPRDPVNVSPDPPGELDLSDPRLVSGSGGGGGNGASWRAPRHATA